MHLNPGMKEDNMSRNQHISREPWDTQPTGHSWTYLWRLHVDCAIAVGEVSSRIWSTDLGCVLCPKSRRLADRYLQSIAVYSFRLSCRNIFLSRKEGRRHA